MKPLGAAILLGIVWVVPAGAQEAGYPAETPGVIYEAPVFYQAPVIYQAPVAYYAPVFYLSGASPTPGFCPPVPCPAPSTVTYIGGRGGTVVQANCGSSGSTVFHFGGQQACAYGYQFNRPR
jgi:hypothetical protein